MPEPEATGRTRNRPEAVAPGPEDSTSDDDTASQPGSSFADVELEPEDFTPRIWNNAMRQSRRGWEKEVLPVLARHAGTRTGPTLESLSSHFGVRELARLTRRLMSHEVGLSRWYCYYCNRKGGEGPEDPARFEAAFLVEFICLVLFLAPTLMQSLHLEARPGGDLGAAVAATAEELRGAGAARRCGGSPGRRPSQGGDAQWEHPSRTPSPPDRGRGEGLRARQRDPC